MQITNGTVEYERAVKPADYEKRGAKLVLSFAVEEGSDAHAVVAKVFDMAVAEVHHRIGLNGPAYVRRMAETDTAKVEEPKRGVQLDAEITAAFGRAPAAAILPEVRADNAKAAASLTGFNLDAPKREAAAAPQSNPTSTPASPAPSNGPDDATVIQLPTSAPATPASSTSASPTAASSVAPAPAPVAADPLTIVAPPTAPASDKPVEITDSDLHAAVHQALERKATALQVRNLTDEFTGVVGQSMRTLPQDKRAAFVAALKELKPE